MTRDDALAHLRHMLTLCRDCGGHGVIRGGYTEVTEPADYRVTLDFATGTVTDTRTSIRRVPDAEVACPSCAEARAFVGEL